MTMSHSLAHHATGIITTVVLIIAINVPGYIMSRKR
jgi:hypothetical protein